MSVLWFYTDLSLFIIRRANVYLVVCVLTRITLHDNVSIFQATWWRIMRGHLLPRRLNFLPPERKWRKVIFSVILFTGGVSAAEGCLLGGLLPGAVCSGRYLLPGVSAPRGMGVCSGGGVETSPPPRWLLLRAVRIILECIFVYLKF